jgi:hypothetical protein
VRCPLFMGGAAPFAGDLALFLRRHRGKSTPFFTFSCIHRPPLPRSRAHIRTPRPCLQVQDRRCAGDINFYASGLSWGLSKNFFNHSHLEIFVERGLQRRLQQITTEGLGSSSE